ncbi:cytochrome C oxidase subunit IV family protein [Psychroserpens sp.]
MNKLASLTWLILIILTIVSAVFSNLDVRFKASIILVLAMLKFVGVAFQFMELKKAHSFWKILIGAYLLVFISIILILK